MSSNVGWVRVANYLKAIRNLYSFKNKFKKRTGRRLLGLDEFESRLAICQRCEHFSGNGCKKCGCCINRVESLFNKIAFPTEKCPDGRWKEID